MKKLLIRFLAFSSIGLLLITSCKKKDVIPTTSGGKPGKLTVSDSVLTLAKADSANLAVTFSFTSPNYGYKAAVTTTFQIDTLGDNFANPLNTFVLAANVNSQSYTTDAFNKLVLGLGIEPGKTAHIQVRIKHSISPGIAPIFTNVVNVSAIPYSVLNISFWYVPGAYQGWTPANADSLISLTSNGIYTGVIAFTPGNLEFKVVPTKGGFNGNLGDAGGGTTTGTTFTTNLSGSGGNITAPTAPTIDPAYNVTSNMITLDIKKNTISLTPTIWGIVGNGAAGWPNTSGPQSDVDMKYDNGKQVWYTVLPLTAGGNQIKFRENHDWSHNYGGTNGVISSNGSNIDVPSTGTYMVTLDIINGTYKLTPQ